MSASDPVVILSQEIHDKLVQDLKDAQIEIENLKLRLADAAILRQLAADIELFDADEPTIEDK